MSALTKDRNTPSRAGEDFVFPVAAATTIWAGALMVLDALGNAKPGAVATGLIAVGRAEEQVDNSAGAAADLTVKVRRGLYRWGNSSSTDEITKAEIGDACYIVDDQTVAKTDASGTRSPAGFVEDVDAQGVWVLTGFGPLEAPAGALLAANNLSDVAAAATARANIGANKAYLEIDATDLSGTDVYRTVATVAGDITKIWSIIEGALTTGDATLTGKIATTAITGGVITITQAGSAAGDVDSATPSAANTVAAGDDVNVTVGGTNASAVRARVIVEITF